MTAWGAFVFFVVAWLSCVFVMLAWIAREIARPGKARTSVVPVEDSREWAERWGLPR